MNVTVSQDSENRLAVTLEFSCEQGHRFSYYIENHKGYTICTETIEPQRDEKEST
jgi:hypothetical protein